MDSDDGAHGAGGFFRLNLVLILTGPGAFALDNVIGATSALRTPAVAGIRAQHRIA